MQKTKRYLFIASVFEIALAGAILIADGVFTGLWLTSLVDGQIGAVDITISITLFILSCFTIFDGIHALKYSKAENGTVMKCKQTRFLLGNIYYILALSGILLGTASLWQNVHIIFMITCFVSSVFYVVIGVLNHLSYGTMVEEKEEPVKPIEPEKLSVDQLLSRMQALTELKLQGLIDEQEFETMRKNLLKRS